MISNVAAVVVHHRSYETVVDAIDSLIRQGVRSENLVLIDNSEELDRRDELRGSVPSEVVIHYVENRGYGAAVNAAIDYFRERQQEKPDFFLVATHETRPEEGAVTALVKALQADPDAAVAGPTLVSGVETEFVWSAGGYMAPITHIPSHYFHRATLEALKEKSTPEDREWLDGAFLVYRWSDIERFRISEEFFLYMEETDLHLRFCKAGRKVLWVPAAQVWQDSGGIPPYYLARNMRLLFRKHETMLRRLAIVPYSVGKRILGDVVWRKNFSTLVPSLRGLFASLPACSEEEPISAVSIVNPLGAALRHYAIEIESVLAQSDVRVEARSVLEPSASGKSSFRWILQYASILRKARRSANTSGGRLLIIWPVLGYWDVVLYRILGISEATLVVHDPHPLVKAVGYSGLAKSCASRFRASIDLLAHSQRALEVIQQEVPQISTTLVPHPILDPHLLQSIETSTPELPVIRVFGQYKPDRDVEALAAVGRALTGSAVLEVHGRGWPEIEGWNVVSGFVEEDRLTKLMAASSVIVIPYKNFFQSGIAIRSLELGVPFVGPRTSVLAEMVGSDSPLLVDDSGPNSWTMAIAHAAEVGKGEARRAAVRWREHNVSAWSSWLRDRLS